MIGINWIPGFVAAIHIMSMHRHHCAATKTISAAGEDITYYITHVNCFKVCNL